MSKKYTVKESEKNNHDKGNLPETNTANDSEEIKPNEGAENAAGENESSTGPENGSKENGSSTDPENGSGENEPLNDPENTVDLLDMEIIEKLKDLMSQRNTVPSRKLCNRAEDLLKKDYVETDKKATEKIEKIIKAISAVQMTCSARFTVKLTMIQSIAEE